MYLKGWEKMTKEALIALGLTEEQASKVLEGYMGYVPKSRFDEVNEAKKKAEANVKERDKQLEELKKSSGDADALKAEIEKLQGENKAAAEKYAADMKALALNNAIEKALTAAGAKNLKAVKALLDVTNAEMDGETVKGLDAQIKALKDDAGSSFLFGEAQPGFIGVPANKNPIKAPNPKVDGFNARLAEARKNGNTLEAIKIKQEAANEGISLL